MQAKKSAQCGMRIAEQAKEEIEALMNLAHGNGTAHGKRLKPQ